MGAWDSKISTDGQPTVDGAEARLAQRRQARAEARAIRLRELEKQARENDEQSDRHYEIVNEPVRPVRSREGRTASFVSSSSYSGSRRSSEDSTEALDGRDIRHQLQEVEESFRKAMISNAQLDNERTALGYQVDTFKDDMEEMEENYLHVQRDMKEKSRAFDLLQRDYKKLMEEKTFLEESLKQRDSLIEEHGLVLVGADEMVNGSEDSSSTRSSPEKMILLPKAQVKSQAKAALISQEAALLLEQAGEGSLDVRLKRFAEEKQELQDQINRLRLDLSEERQKVSRMEQISLVHGPQTNGPEMRLMEVQREANKQVDDYKYKLRKAEQEILTLQSNVSRLETQVVRYKTATEEAEKLEDELKAEKRKLQRECREAQVRIEELETANQHLQKRIDKLKSARNALK
ncbi:leucine-rich repeat flightless-interacting protein 2-like isoform X1 [Ornithodoros turicata]|uniref:leucine-rich repeat flightless-interacting protein 2-like isoform X1 n=1 Tax=Ornithodoros turicata TaxID=34597 RepID=UPI003139329E